MTTARRTVAEFLYAAAAHSEDSGLPLAVDPSQDWAGTIYGDLDPDASASERRVVEVALGAIAHVARREFVAATVETGRDSKDFPYLTVTDHLNHGAAS